MIDGCWGLMRRDLAYGQNVEADDRVAQWIEVFLDISWFQWETVVE